MPPVPISIKLILGCAPVAALMQAAAGGLPPELSWVGQAERLTLVGALVVAVGVLWKTLSRKDDQIMAATQSTTTALIAASESNRELRKIVEESVRAKQDLRVSIDDLRDSIRGCLYNSAPPVQPSHRPPL